MKLVWLASNRKDVVGTLEVVNGEFKAEGERASFLLRSATDILRAWRDWGAKPGRKPTPEDVLNWMIEDTAQGKNGRYVRG